MYLVIICFSKTSWQYSFQQNDNIRQIWLIISTLPITKMRCMLKHFRCCLLAGVEQLCLLAKLCCKRLRRST